MRYVFWFWIIPAAVSFLAQSILCFKVKKGMLRHSALIFPVIFIAFGIITLLTQSGGAFGGLGAIAAVLWFTVACCAAFGYGTAWLVFFITKKRRNRTRKD